MLRNGSGSKTDQLAKAGKGKVKARGKERKEATVIEGANLCATIGARGTGTAATLLSATSLMIIVLKEESKEKEKEQHRYRRKP